MTTTAPARDILNLARSRGWMIATAESCTGGMIAASLTDIAGSSAIFDRGFVTYSNEAKQEMLGVRAETLARHGAVSPETAREMAAGALARSRAHLALSVTGIAGPGGGSADKPVGLVWFAVAGKSVELEAFRHVFPGPDRAAIRAAAVQAGLAIMLQALKSGIDGP
jgi:nicotinamide-nucleotide amidase